MIHCAVWYHLYKLKIVKNTDGEVVLFLNLEAVKEALLHGCFSCFFKLYEWYKIVQSITNPAGIYLLKVNNGSTRTRCEICSKLTIKIPERRHWRRSGIFIVNFEHISHLVLVFLLLTLNM